MGLIHQFGRNDQSAFLTSTNVVQTIGDQATRLVVSVFPLLAQHQLCFRWARVTGVTYRIEWKGTLNLHTDTGDTDDIGSVPLVREDLLLFRGHEILNGKTSDGTNAGAQTLGDMLGMAQYPVIDTPHTANVYSTNQEATTPWGSLMTDKRITRLTFNQNRQVHYVKWKPLTRVDRLGCFWDLDKLVEANNTTSTFDDDARSGGIFLYRNTMWTTGFNAGTNVDDLFRKSNALFEITARVHVVFGGWKNATSV